MKTLKDQLLAKGFKESVPEPEVTPTSHPHREFIKADSPHWNWKDGVCTKHYLPSVPCPACLAENDPDMYEGASAMERMLWDDLDYYNDMMTTGF